jgi:hypothetical protein
VKYYLLLLLAVGALAQSSATMYTTDLNGHRVEAITQQTTKTGGVTEVTQSLNGRKVPLQQTELRILSESANARVTETITRKFDPNGQLSGIERIVSDERKAGDRTTIQATISRSDLQGRLVEQERRQVETVSQGPGITVTDVNISRPSISGSFETTEKRNIVANRQKDSATETEVILRPSLNGQFAEAAREVRDVQQVAGKTVETTANYELDYNGRIQLNKQQRSIISKAADGSELTEVNIFGLNSDGAVRDEQDGVKIKEQQLVIRSKAADGSVTETTSVRRPSLADDAVLGPATKISETTCKGMCNIPLPSAK